MGKENLLNYIKPFLFDDDDEVLLFLFLSFPLFIPLGSYMDFMDFKYVYI